MFTAEPNPVDVRIARWLVALEDRATELLRKPEVRETLHIAAGVLLTLALMVIARYAFATDGAEFAAGSTTVEGWAKGNPGKICALAGVLYGSVRAMFMKDMMAFALPSMTGIAVGVVVGIIDASFTATI